MSFHLRLASAFSIFATLTYALVGASGTKASAQDVQMQVTQAQGASAIVADSTRATLPADVTVGPQQDARIDPAVADNDDTAPVQATSLVDLVDATPIPASVPRDIECLASAIYFEARSESLAGQLAVGRVIVARTASGRFPTSYCGVVLQRSQFSFIHHGALPTIDHGNHMWQRSVRIALIAARGRWKSPAEGALFFHAKRVGPVAGKIRVAQIDNHVFYR
ncbi:cell wall hydrolase, SleB [Novosphingobium nitrogenifigens DSM 19370]|uniref:Cell wall hydrolase, SleB n=1 Tax=Novosphingobium nitrogenifigens DSM 19370 TaxID=983920 RepID=F1Z5T2_9SPHN|nr:cell wall hydrolase [Novosphingobium nitrogenifigens]EGD60192.1 cell wall hydrolase, SleB [Novosphingobium nitrogenifigens DSM 19370]